MQIAIANTDGNVSLWCNVRGINEDGSINFWVINGAWRGRYNNGQVYVEDDTESTFPGMLVWVGEAAGLREHSDGKWSKFPNSYYNEAIHWIQEQIDDPDYVMTQPDQYVEPVVEQDEEDEWDDIPF